MHNLLESWVLPSSITNFAVMLEDYLQVVLIFLSDILKIELVGSIRHIFVDLLILFGVVAVRDRLNRGMMNLLLMHISFHLFVLMNRFFFMILLALILEI